MKYIYFIPLFIITIFLVGCSGQPLIPIDKMIPSSKGVGFVNNNNFATSLAEANKFDAIGFYAITDTSGDIPEIIQVAYSNNVKAKPVVSLNFFDAGTGIAVAGYGDENYNKVLIKIAETYKPEYLGVGNEVDRYSNINEFAIVQNKIYDKIKEVSPHTKVFTVFQYESMTDWSVINKFKLDAVGFTTYPQIKYATMDEIPEDYYKHMNIGKPVLITEFGWSSKDEAEQARFLNVFNSRLGSAGVGPELKIWGLLYDYPLKGGIWTDMGLIKTDGTKKQVYNEFIK